MVDIDCALSRAGLEQFDELDPLTPSRVHEQTGLSEGRMSEVGRSEELNTREVESWSYTNAITPDLGGRNSTTDVKTVKEGRGGQKKRCSTLEMSPVLCLACLRLCL